MTVEMPQSGEESIFFGAGPTLLGEGDVLAGRHSAQDGTDYEFELTVDSIDHHEPETGPEVIFAPKKLASDDLNEIRFLLADRFPTAYAAGMDVDSSMTDGSENWFVSVVLGPLDESRGEVATLRVKCLKEGGPWQCQSVRRERRYVIPGNSVPVLVSDNVSYELAHRIQDAVHQELAGYGEIVDGVLGTDWQISSIHERLCDCYMAAVEGEFRGRTNTIFFGVRPADGAFEIDPRGCQQGVDWIG